MRAASRPCARPSADFHRRTLGAEIGARAHHRSGRGHAGGRSWRCNRWWRPGDNIVVVSPIWPNIFQAAEICGAEVRYARLDDDWNASAPRWHLDLEKLFDACDARTKAIFIASPGNPTGWMHDAGPAARSAGIRARRAASRSSATKSMARSSSTAARMRRLSCRSPSRTMRSSSSTVSPSPGR